MQQSHHALLFSPLNFGVPFGSIPQCLLDLNEKERMLITRRSLYMRIFNRTNDPDLNKQATRKGDSCIVPLDNAQAAWNHVMKLPRHPKYTPIFHVA